MHWGRILHPAVFLLLSLTGPVSALEAGDLRVVFDRGAEIRLDRTTVSKSSVEPTIVEFSSATVEKPVYLVEVTLRDAARRRFGELTKIGIRKTMKFIFNGRVVAEPVTQTSITGGRFVIPTRSADDAISMIKAMISHRL